MEKKYGVYICSGCDIGNSLDIEKLSAVAAKSKVPICKSHPILCSPAGVDLIKQDIAGEGVNTVIIAACSPRVMYDVFDFGPVLVERVNLREGVVWSHEAVKAGGEGGETAVDPEFQMLAEDYVRMGIVKAQKGELPEPYKPEEEINKKILVIGGGVTGMSAALDAANGGYEVTLVEKENQLGGFAARLYKQAAKKYPYTDIETPDVQSKINAVSSHAKIDVRTETEVARIAGAPGLYHVSFKPAGTETEWDVPPKAAAAEGEEAAVAEAAAKYKDIMTLDENAERYGAVILATGWKPYDATKLDALGFGKYPNVITNVMMEELASKGSLVRPSDGKPVKSVAFIQCAGQRDEKHLPYCSATCCITSLKQAKYVREQGDEAKAFIFYKDMRTPGQYENFYKSMQQDPGVFLTKGDVVSISEDARKNLTVEVDNTLIGEKIEVNVDMVVLATGMVPTTQDEAIINLAYRQGPGLIDLELFNGFADSNFICFPYETRRTGVYAAGTVRQPMTIPMCEEDAAGAALKAIQCIESAYRGVAVHPRSGDMSYPDFFFARCTQCKRCTEECPFGALDDDEKGTPKPNPTRCRRCGTCMGACPERIIGFKNYNIDMIGSMVKSFEVPEEDGIYRVLAFVCENDAYPAMDMAAMKGLKFPAAIRVIPVRCLGSMNTVWIKDAMSRGIDGIILLGCKYGDDYQCHFAKGSELANRRMENVAETLKSLALESERVRLVQVAIDEYDKIPQIFNEFMEQMEAVGPSPMKGF
ncbi:MAG: FAD-dependent oxidoreductase [Thermodesulfobacteriota bacterium]